MNRLVLLLGVTLLSGPALAQLPLECDPPDIRCFKTGCSGEICASDVVDTTCIFLCETGCLARANCVCSGRTCKSVGHGLKSCLRGCQSLGAEVSAGTCEEWVVLEDGRQVQWINVRGVPVEIEKLADGREAIDGKAILEILDREKDRDDS